MTYIESGATNQRELGPRLSDGGDNGGNNNSNDLRDRLPERPDGSTPAWVGGALTGGLLATVAMEPVLAAANKIAGQFESVPPKKADPSDTFNNLTTGMEVGSITSIFLIFSAIGAAIAQKHSHR